jgi:hypothetical protein
MVFIETEYFTRNLQKSAGKDSDSILRAIQDDLLANHMRGDAVQSMCGNVGFVVRARLQSLCVDVAVGLARPYPVGGVLQRSGKRSGSIPRFSAGPWRRFAYLNG